MAKPLPNPPELTIVHHWRTYRQKCVPQSASRAQIDATETAFYGGALIILETVIALADYDDDRAEELLEGLKAEADAYLEAVQTRHQRRWH